MTNVSQSRPSFPSHYQPHIPGELGFYDLRLEETAIKQADLAKAYGIHGFCYYYYYFAGKKLMDQPINRMRSTGKLISPFAYAGRMRLGHAVGTAPSPRYLLSRNTMRRQMSIFSKRFYLSSGTRVILRLKRHPLSSFIEYLFFQIH